MSVQIKTPNITASNDRERLRQIQSYLYQMAQQLQWAFDNIGTAGGGGSAAQMPVQTGKTAAVAMDPASTFSGLKNLIIKSADIVDAYYTEISRRLEGMYVAQSDFGIFSEQTELEILENSTNINQIFSNEQTIYSRLDGLDSENQMQNNQTNALASGMAGLSETVGGLSAETKSMAETVNGLYVQSIQTNAYLKSGLLAYAEDGTAIYGLEIGQSNSINGTEVFDKFARFSADRLSFYDKNDIEVAYISDYKLYITNAEITGSLWLSGKFKIYYNGGLAFQWIGGES